jgi:microcystin-dependent protein
MSTITTINASDTLANSRAVINTNFSNLNSDKVEDLADLGLTESAANYNTAAQSTAFLVPTGAILPFPASSVPTGWLQCYGQAVSRTTYSALFAVISTTYGVGDNSTTFNLPDLRGRVIAALDNLGSSSANRVTSVNADSLGGVFGAETHTLTSGEIPAHTHPSNVTSTGTGATTNFSVAGGGTVDTSSTAESTGANTGGGGAHNNVQPTMFMSYIIKI